MRQDSACQELAAACQAIDEHGICGQRGFRCVADFPVRGKRNHFRNLLRMVRPTSPLFFRMKLHAGHVVACNRGGDVVAVVGACRQHIRRILRPRRKAMHEIGAIARFGVLQQRPLPRMLGLPEFRPADVRNHVRRAISGGSRDHGNVPADQAKPFVAAEFLAVIQHRLHADADAEERLAGCREVADGFGKSAFSKRPEGRSEGADTG